MLYKRASLSMSGERVAGEQEEDIRRDKKGISVNSKRGALVPPRMRLS